MIKLKWYLIPVAVWMLVACGDEDNSEPPAELVKFTPSARIELLWSKYVHEGVGQQYLTIEPLLIGDKIITAGRDGDVSVVDKYTGDIVSEVELDADLSGGVGGNKDTWLFATRDGNLIAIEAATGDVMWKVALPSEALSPPVIYSNNVLVRTVDGQILNLDLATGKSRWSYQQSNPPLTLRGSSQPVITRDRIYAGLASGRLVALSVDKGEVIWDVAQTVPQGRSEIQRLVDIDGRSELYGPVLYVSSYQGRMTAIDVVRGQFLWARPFSSYSGVTIDDKYVYSSDDRSHVWALDRFNGATVWKQEKLQARRVTRPVLVADYIAVGDFDGYIHLMSRQDGHFVARTMLGDISEDDVGENGIIVPPLVDGNTLYVTARNGMLYAFSVHASASVN